MNTPTNTGKGYQLSFIINSIVGGLLLVFAVAGFILEREFPVLQGGGLVWGFVPGAAVCLCVGFFHRQKYLGLRR